MGKSCEKDRQPQKTARWRGNQKSPAFPAAKPSAAREVLGNQGREFGKERRTTAKEVAKVA